MAVESNPGVGSRAQVGPALGVGVPAARVRPGFRQGALVVHPSGRGILRVDPGAGPGGAGDDRRHTGPAFAVEDRRARTPVSGRHAHLDCTAQLGADRGAGAGLSTREADVGDSREAVDLRPVILVPLADLHHPGSLGEVGPDATRSDGVKLRREGTVEGVALEIVIPMAVREGQPGAEGRDHCQTHRGTEHDVPPSHLMSERAIRVEAIPTKTLPQIMRKKHINKRRFCQPSFMRLSLGRAVLFRFFNPCVFSGKSSCGPGGLKVESTRKPIYVHQLPRKKETWAHK